MTTKPELEGLAAEYGVEIKSDDTKNEIVGKLLGAGVEVPQDALDEYNDAKVADAPDAESVEGEVPEGSKLAELDTEQVHVGSAGPSTTVTSPADELPAADDAMPAVAGDARVDDGGVRTNSAVEPIADALGSGAGQHVPAPSNVGADGRERFPDGVAPTAKADYDGPNAPAGQSAEAVEAAQSEAPESER